MLLTLPNELEQAILNAAQTQGTTPNQFVVDALTRQLISEPETEPVPESLLDFLGEFVGCIHSSENVPGGAQMSTDSGRKFTEGMLKKRLEGKL